MDNSCRPIPPGVRGEPASMGHRHYDRHPAYFNVMLNDLAEPEPPVAGFVANVSRRGVCVMLPITLPTGQAIRMQIAQTVLFGDVVHSHSEGGYVRTGIAVRWPVKGPGTSELLRAMLVEPPQSDPAALDRPSNIVRTVSRRHLRYPVSGTLRVLWRDGEGDERIGNAKIQNASVMGARLLLDEMIPVRSCVSCDDEALHIRGTASVRYCRFRNGKYHVGLEFSGDNGWRRPGKVPAVQAPI